MDQLPSQYDNRTFDEQLKAFMQCKSAITKKPDTFMYYPYLDLMKNPLKKGLFIFFNVDFVIRRKGHRPYLQFYLACYHNDGEKTLYYPINVSFYAYNDNIAPIITLVPNKQYSVNRNATGYRVENDNSVHFDFWKDPDNVNDLEDNYNSIDQLFKNLTTLFSRCSPYICRHNDFRINPEEIVVNRKQMGKGASGFVYEGIYNGIPVAIKFMLCLPGQPAYVHERDISLLMDHPSVITTYGYTIVDSLPFYGFGKCMNLKQVALVMEKADSDLVYYLATVPMSYSQRKHMIVEIGCGLEYLYNQNICNHDLKPDNILVKNNKVKISDFGLSIRHRHIQDIRESALGQGNTMHLSFENRRIHMIRKLEREGHMIDYPRPIDDEILEIERKEDVYGLGVLIMDILLGPAFMERYITTLFFRRGGEDYTMTIPDKLNKDPVIVRIVEDCIKPFDKRPYIPDIIERLKEWEQIPTDANQEVEFQDIIGSLRLQ